MTWSFFSWRKLFCIDFVQIHVGRLIELGFDRGMAVQAYLAWLLERFEGGTSRVICPNVFATLYSRCERPRTLATFACLALLPFWCLNLSIQAAFGIWKIQGVKKHAVQRHVTRMRTTWIVPSGVDAVTFPVTFFFPAHIFRNIASPRLLFLVHVF